MNRIVLICNGFDLAHGLKTSYEDFMRWYWIEWGNRLLKSFKKEEEDALCSIKINPDSVASKWFDIWNFYCLKEELLGKWDPIEVIRFAHTRKEWSVFEFKSLFLENICKSKARRPWVNIEEEYYALLKQSTDPEHLNNDLEFIKVKLIEYLNSLQDAVFKPNIKDQIFAPISKEEIAIESKSQWEEMVKERLNYVDVEWNNLFDGYYSDYGSKRAAESSIEHFKSEFETEIRSGTFDTVMESICPAFRLPNNIMLLDFNYTDTTDLYIPKADKFTVNHIHGRLSNPESVIFGYGDELDNSFKELLDKNNDEYLRNIKSIRYQEVPNYRNMLRFIESSPYQIYIMGHSCGNSDRTMLNTLFEHRNCVSIKPFYHKWDDGTDNYMEIVQNIARNFTDMKLMRDRVVNKTFCQTI